MLLHILIIQKPLYKVNVVTYTLNATLCSKRAKKFGHTCISYASFNTATKANK